MRIGIVLFPEGAAFWMPVLIVLATINVVYGAISALGQQDLKYVVGYSSVSHMGYVLMGIATLEQLGVSGAVLQMFSHGIMTALFFAAVGFIYDRAHTRDIGVLEPVAAGAGLVQAAQGVEQGGLARTRGAGDRDVFAAADVQIHARQGRDVLTLHRIGAGDAFDVDHSGRGIRG